MYDINAIEALIVELDTEYNTGNEEIQKEIKDLKGLLSDLYDKYFSDDYEDHYK